MLFDQNLKGGLYALGNLHYAIGLAEWRTARERSTLIDHGFRKIAGALTRPSFTWLHPIHSSLFSNGYLGISLVHKSWNSYMSSFFTKKTKVVLIIDKKYMRRIFFFGGGVLPTITKTWWENDRAHSLYKEAYTKMLNPHKNMHECHHLKPWLSSSHCCLVPFDLHLECQLSWTTLRECL